MNGLLVRKLLSDIRSQVGQFAAIVVTMIVGVALFGASYDAYRNLQSSYDRVFEELAFADRWFTGLGPDAAAALEDLDGVEAATARTVDEVPLRFNGDHVLLGRAVSMPPDSQPPINRLHLLDGEYLSSSEDSVILESHSAEHFDLRPGDSVEVLGQSGWITLPIRGVAVSAEYIWPARSRQDVLTSRDDFGVVFVSEAVRSRMLSIDTTPEVLVRYAASAEGSPSEVDARIVEAARRLGFAATHARGDQPSNAALNEDIQGFGEMAIMFPLLFVSATVMGTYIVLSRLVRAQRPLIGTLLATGFSRRAIFWHYLGYGVVPATVAGVLGVGAGVALAYEVTNLYTDTIGLPFRVHETHTLTAVAGVVFALAAGVVAAAPPALAAIAMSPAEAMRGSSPSCLGGSSLIERFVPRFSALPIRWRLVARNIGRQRRRAGYSAAGIVLALILVLISWGMLDTTQILIDRQFNQIQRWDARVYLDDGAEIASVAEVDGVAAVEPVTMLGVAVANGARSYSTQLIAYSQETQMHNFLGGGGSWVALPASGALAGQSLKSVLGIGEGDQVALQVPGAAVETPITIVGFVNEPLGTFLYVSHEQLATLINGAAAPASPGLSSVEVIYEEGVDRAAVRDALMAVPSVVAVTDARSLLETLEEFLGLFYAFVGAMLLFGGLMAGALIFTSMTANVAERSAELAGLRAAGMPESTLSWLLSIENLVTAALGVVPGLVLGYLTSAAFMSSFSSDLFQFDLQMRWTTPILATVGVLVLAALAQLPALRSLRRLDLVSVLRTRAL
jgi:putative ABC transport system permease protein